METWITIVLVIAIIYTRIGLQELTRYVSTLETKIKLLEAAAKE